MSDYRRQLLKAIAGFARIRQTYDLIIKSDPMYSPRHSKHWDEDRDHLWRHLSSRSTTELERIYANQKCLNAVTQKEIDRFCEIPAPPQGARLGAFPSPDYESYPMWVVTFPGRHWVPFKHSDLKRVARIMAAGTMAWWLPQALLYHVTKINEDREHWELIGRLIDYVRQ